MFPLFSQIRIFTAFRTFALFFVFFIGATQLFAQPSVYPTYKNCWQFAGDKATQFAPVAVENKLFVALSDGNVAALDATNGSLLWQMPLGGEIVAPPQVAKIFLVVASRTLGEENGASELTIRAVSQSTGVTFWQKKYSSAENVSLLANENVFFIYLGQKSEGGKLYSINVENGDANWMKTVPSNFSTELSANENYLYVATADGNLQLLKKSDGNLHKQFQIKRTATGKITVSNGNLIFGDEAGNIVSLQETDGHIKWSLRTGGSIQNILPTAEGVVISSLDNFVYLLNSETGKRRWRRRLVGRPVSVSQLSPDVLLLLTNGDGNFAILRLKTGKYLAQNSLGVDNYAVASPASAQGRLFISTFKGILTFAEPNVSCETQTVKGKK